MSRVVFTRTQRAIVRHILLGEDHGLLPGYVRVSVRSLERKGALRPRSGEVDHGDLSRWLVTVAGTEALREGCRYCGGPVPEVSGYRPRTVCDGCMGEARRDGQRITTARRDHQRRPLPSHRACPQCPPGTPPLPLDTEHFYVQKRDPETGEIVDFARWCKTCKRRKAAAKNRTPEQREARRRWNRAYYEKRYKNDPEFREKEKARRREWYAENKAIAAAHTKRWFARLKADPERYQTYLQNGRIDYRLRRLKGGLVVRDGERRTSRALEAEPKSGGYVPIAPFRRWLEDLDLVPEELSVLLEHEVDPRRIREWLRKGEWIQLDLVDRVLTRYGEPWRLQEQYPRLKDVIVPSTAMAGRVDPQRVLEVGFEEAFEEDVDARSVL